jgi:hypothetical protein
MRWIYHSHICTSLGERGVTKSATAHTEVVERYTHVMYRLLYVFKKILKDILSTYTGDQLLTLGRKLILRYMYVYLFIYVI